MKFIRAHQGGGKGTWQRLAKSPAYVIWSGFSFETVCLKHIQQIKTALRIDAIYSTHSSWFNNNAQVDLLIDRDDNVINLCEMKFYSAPFAFDKRYYHNLKNKIAELQRETGTRKNIFVTMVTTLGVVPNAYSAELVQNSLEMESLFSA